MLGAAVAIRMPSDLDDKIAIHAQRCGGIGENLLCAGQQPIGVCQEIHARQINNFADLATFNVNACANSRIRALIETVDDAVIITIELTTPGIYGRREEGIRALVLIVDHTIAIAVARAAAFVNSCAGWCVQACIAAIWYAITIGVAVPLNRGRRRLFSTECEL